MLWPYNANTTKLIFFASADCQFQTLHFVLWSPLNINVGISGITEKQSNIFLIASIDSFQYKTECKKK
jgi:hypothetical protein